MTAPVPWSAMASTGGRLTARVREFLDAPRFAVIGTVGHDRSPHLTVIWYERRGDEVVFNTTVERAKARNLRADPHASLLVGGADRYVRLDGRAREVARGAEALADIRRLGVRYGDDESADRQVRDVWSKQDRVTYALTVERVYRYGVE